MLLACKLKFYKEQNRLCQMLNLLWAQDVGSTHLSSLALLGSESSWSREFHGPHDVEGPDALDTVLDVSGA